ncbi:hypothetical protein AB7M26_003556 [Pseudomonas sp. F-14 TE3482]
MLLSEAEGNTEHGVIRQSCSDPARSETLCTSGSPLHRNWEISAVPGAQASGGAGKAKSRNPATYAAEKSDTSVVPEKPSNKGSGPAEIVEERDVAKGNTNKPPAPRTLSRISCASMGLEGVREAARRNRGMQFTALLHHITPQLLAQSFYALRRDAAVGVDGMSWREYEEGLLQRAADLHARLHGGAYRATPSRRVYIPKADGRQRPLGNLWARQWRERHARGDVIVVRYADDSVVGFRTQWQAQQFLVQLQERLARFGLSLNASKTRLIEFGRFAARNRRKRGLGKPETFDFLGFTHCCSTNRSGGFQILRLTVKKRMRATLQSIRVALNRRRHEPVQIVGRWLGSVVGGYFNYHAVPGNLLRLDGFRVAVCRLWRQALKRRSQRNRLQWSRYGRLADLYIPRPRTVHPYPEERFASRT